MKPSSALIRPTVHEESRRNSAGTVRVCAERCVVSASDRTGGEEENGGNRRKFRLCIRISCRWLFPHLRTMCGPPISRKYGFRAALCISRPSLICTRVRLPELRCPSARAPCSPFKHCGRHSCAIPHPVIFHSDNGSECVAKAFVGVLARFGVRVSRTHPGCP